MNNWISNIDTEELGFIAPVLFVIQDNPEQAAMFLYREGMMQPMNALIDKEEFFKRAKAEMEARPPKKYWEQVKLEFTLLLCTDDPKYKKLQESLNDAGDKGTKYIVGIISSSIGAALGIEAGIISVFCAVLLHAAVKMGIEAYCNLQANA